MNLLCFYAHDILAIQLLDSDYLTEVPVEEVALRGNSMPKQVSILGNNTICNFSLLSLLLSYYYYYYCYYYYYYYFYYYHHYYFVLTACSRGSCLRSHRKGQQCASLRARLPTLLLCTYLGRFHARRSSCPGPDSQRFSLYYFV